MRIQYDQKRRLVVLFRGLECIATLTLEEYAAACGLEAALTITQWGVR